MPEQHADTTLLNALFDAAVDAIIVADAKGCITRASRAAEDLFGYPPESLVGQNVSVLMPKAMAERHDSFMAHHIATGERRIIGIGRDLEARHRDGHIIPIHLSVGRAELDSAPVFIAILHDLSSRRVAEEALARSQRLDAIGKMTGGIAHDFNNLLTIVVGNLELLQMRIREGHEAQLIADALEAAELGADLTSRLMVFARKGDLRPELLDMNAVCEKSLAILKRTLGPALKIRTRFAEGLGRIMVDETQLQTSILNLALNARDAMPEGGRLLFATGLVEIDDSYIAQETDIGRGKYVRLSVSDTGTGMSEEAQKRAFEPFFTTKPSGKGTGFGLSMVYGFVRQSGGHITLYSEPGNGTTVSLYFPVADADQTGASSGTDRSSTLPRGDGQLVLVVEDNEEVRRLSVERITDLGYRTLEAATGDEAYNLLTSRDDIAVVFSDLVMPGGLNGHQLATRVLTEFPGISVILTSGYAEDVMSLPSWQGTLPLLRKPYRQRELAEVLRDQLTAP